MTTEVLTLLSGFLGAMPSQVGTWDKKVIDYLTRDAEAYQAFKSGTDSARWDIYAGVKYSELRAGAQPSA